MAALQLSLDENLFLKNPQSTALGKTLIQSGIQLIAEMALEAFTFKKFSRHIDSSEASICRYFENKHRLLTYLIGWYRAWTEHKIHFETHNIPDAEIKLDHVLYIISERKEQDRTFPDIDESALQQILIAESDKTYLTHNVDQDNKEGLFKGNKSLCTRISQLIKKINPYFPYPHAIISTALEASHQQIFFAIHLPSLTDISKTTDPFQADHEFLKAMIFNTIKI